MKKIAFIFLSIFLFQNSEAQYFSSGEDPASVRYNCFDTPHFLIVFPRELGEKAWPIGTMLEQSYANVRFYPEYAKVGRTEVLLHTQNSSSNGFVVWAPKRMELMLLPPSDFGPISWERELAIHEFRHISQISTFYKSLTKLPYYFLGQQGIGIMTALVPQWFYEGDAVVAETAYSQSGRGRNSDFMLPYRTRMAEQCSFSFDQNLNGSYKTYIPNHYAFGYLLNSYSDVKYGNRIMDTIFRYTTRNPYLFAPFSFGIKKYTGRTRSNLFHDALNFYDSIWNNSQYDKRLSANRLIKNVYKNYYYPLLSNGLVYSIKTSLDKTPRLVAVDSLGNESVLRYVNMPNSRPSIDGRFIYWTEDVESVRWGQEVYSVIKCFDTKSHKISRISDFGHYQFPVAKGDSLIAFKYLKNRDIKLFISSKNLVIGKEMDIPFGQAKDLQWVGNSAVYTALNGNEEMVVVRQSLVSGAVDTLMNFGRRNLISLRVDGNRLCFISDFTGKSMLYAYNIETKTLSSIYKPKYGIGDYAIKNSSICASSYTVDGYNLAWVAEKSVDVDSSNLSVSGYPVAEMLSNQVKVNLQDSSSNGLEYKTKKYSRVGHLFNFHSWAPFYFDPQEVNTELDQTIYPGVTLVSQNLLSSSYTSLGYGFVDNNHVFSVSYQYKGWLPVIQFKYRRLNEYPDVFAVKGHPYLLDSNSRRTQLGISTYMPLTFSSGVWNYKFQPLTEYNRYNDIMFSRKTNEYSTGYEQVVLSGSFSVQTAMALQNILPRWGFDFYFKNVSAPFENENLGNLYAYKVGITIPGLFKNHGISSRLCYQNQDVQRYYFSNTFKLPRGYNYSFVSKYYKVAFNDYVFPIAYPDWNVSWLVYLKRIRMDLFADFAENVYKTYVKGNPDPIYPSKFYSSVGVNLFFDVHLLRSAFPITLGVQYAYNNDGTSSVNSVFAINMY